MELYQKWILKLDFYNEKKISYLHVMNVIKLKENVAK